MLKHLNAAQRSRPRTFCYVPVHFEISFFAVRERAEKFLRFLREDPAGTAGGNPEPAGNEGSRGGERRGGYATEERRAVETPAPTAAPDEDAWKSQVSRHAGRPVGTDWTNKSVLERIEVAGSQAGPGP